TPIYADGDAERRARRMWCSRALLVFGEVVGILVASEGHFMASPRKPRGATFTRLRSSLPAQQLDESCLFCCKPVYVAQGAIYFRGLWLHMPCYAKDMGLRTPSRDTPNQAA